MFVVLAFLAGVIIGWRRAARRGGVLADKLQYGFVHGVALAILVLFLQVIATHLGLFAELP